MITKDVYALPAHSFRGSPLQHAARLLGPNPAVRIAASVRRWTLDRALSQGADPAASRLLAARAAQLSSAATRTRIADGLENLTRSADAPRSRTRVRPPRAAVVANRSELSEIAGMLRQQGPLYARGLAMLRVLLTDGTGPAYTDRCGEVLAGELRIARARLVG